MLHDLAQIDDEYDRFEGQETTVRCRISGDAMSGDRQGQKTLYEIEDPRGNLDTQTFLSFWTEEPAIPGVARTADYVLESLATRPGSDEPVLDRGERLLVRGVPKRAPNDPQERLFLNVTSVIIRSPHLQIGKGEMSVRSSCERRYYLNFVKKVYNPSFPVNGSQFRGDVVHRVAERAVEEHLDRFVNHAWTADAAVEFVDEVLDEEFGIRMAQLSIAGVGLDDREDAREIVARLFTSEEFCDRVADTPRDAIQAEQSLAAAYGFRGDVDLVLDGVPYDFKTAGRMGEGRYDRQLQVYLLGFLLERADVGDSLEDRLDDVPAGFVVYPNLADSDTVEFGRVTLTRGDIADVLKRRNDVVAGRDTFGPPSPYNRDCETCSLRTGDDLVSRTGADGGRTSLPSACKHHCQSERRWPCYELTDGGEVESECSLFEECSERLEYRDPDRVDHYNRLRSALTAEEEARRTAGDLLHHLGADDRRRSGLLLSGLSFTGAAIGSATFEADEELVPAFTPGDTVILLKETDGAPGREVTYLGRQAGTYRFQFDVQQYIGFLNEDATYRAEATFQPESVSRKYLPFLDYAQRRGHARQFEHDDLTGIPDLGADARFEVPGQITDHLDNTEVFLDVPVRSDRRSVLREAVEELITAPYPVMDGDGSVPEEGRRALVLGATPEQVDLAAAARPEGDHYRMDEGATGERAIRPSDSYHEIQQRWRDSRSLLSSVQHAMETERFHSLVEGAFGDRDHSDRFFDVLVLVGAESLTEPEYLFLSDLADRVVAIGDRRGLGPSMLSAEAREQGLDRSYFAWAHSRHADLPKDTAVSLQIPGESSNFVQQLYPGDEWHDSQTAFSFLEIEGRETVATEAVELEASVRARNSAPFRLTFDISDTPPNPFEVQSTIADQEYLDATALHEGQVALIDEMSMFVADKRQLESDSATHHQIRIKIDVSQAAAFGRAFLYNRPEARIVAQVADEFGAEAVVTPFKTHANELRDRLAEENSSVSVVLPEQLGEGRLDRAIVSFGVSNAAGILHPPLNNPSMLYRLLSCADEVLLVGHGPTLRSKRDLEELVDQQAADYGR